MARYFYTANASRPYKAGGLSFVFEVVGSVALQRVGVLEVVDEKSAEALAKHGAPVEEIDRAQFDDLKKNAMNSSPSWLVSPRAQAPASPRPPAQPVQPAASLPASTAATTAAAPTPASAEAASVEDDDFFGVASAPSEPPPDLPPEPASGKKRRGGSGNK